MKKVFVLIIIIIITIEQGVAQSRWNWITRYPTGNYAISSCQSEGRLFYFGWPRTFFFTSDGGNSFKVITPFLPIIDVGVSGDDRISFADSLQGIIIDADGALRTTDAGESWYNAFGSGYHFSMVNFGNKDVGWIVGSSGFFKTLNSGNTWQSLSNSGIFNIPGSFSQIFASDENKLWICKNFSYNKGGDICFSSDGGSSWTVQNTMVSDSNHQVYYHDIKINKSGIGIAVGQIYLISESSQYIPFILRTSDFGNNWNIVHTDSIFNPKSVTQKDSENWLILGTKKYSSYGKSIPMLLKSSDAGITWIYKENIFKSSSYSYNAPTTSEYLESENILLVSAYDGIYRSYNFGDSFTRLSNNNEIWVHRFALDYYPTSETQIAVAISRGDSLIISEDGGRNWGKKYISELGMFTGSVAVANGYVFASINSDLYVTSDVGNSWTKIYTGNALVRNITACSRNDISFVSNIGYSPFLFYTFNGGITWFKTPFVESCKDIQMVNPGEVYACGVYYDSISNKGYLFNSNDYGHNWHLFDTKRDMEKIRKINSSTILSHSYYEVYRSTDEGNSWNIVLSSNDFFKYYSNFAFKDSLHGIMKISYELFKSYNAGLTWSKSSLSLPMWGELKYMDYNKYGDLIIVGDGGLCININNITDEKLIPELQEVENICLSNNYPNPFNPSTKIKFTIPNTPLSFGEGRGVRLVVYDILGNEIATLINEELSAGEYEIEFDGTGIPSGIYFYTLKAGEFTDTKKFVLLK